MTTLFYLDIGFEAWLFSNLLRVELWLKQDLVQNKKIQVRGYLPNFFQTKYERAQTCWRLNTKANSFEVFFVLIWNRGAYKTSNKTFVTKDWSAEKLWEVCWKFWGYNWHDNCF